jgi:hypothetical protein
MDFRYRTYDACRSRVRTRDQLLRQHQPQYVHISIFSLSSSLCLLPLDIVHVKNVGLGISVSVSVSISNSESNNQTFLSDLLILVYYNHNLTPIRSQILYTIQLPIHSGIRRSLLNTMYLRLNLYCHRTFPDLHSTQEVRINLVHQQIRPYSSQEGIPINQRPRRATARDAPGSVRLPRKLWALL